MKRNNITIVAAALFAGNLLSSCDVWGSSVDMGMDPNTYYYGWDGEYLPTLAGAPIYSPYYYGGTSYPIYNWGTVHRPGYGPWGSTAIPSRPNRPAGNTRPGGEPMPLPDKVPVPSGNSVVPSTPINLGSNPGIQLPPAGSGMKYTPNQGRH